MFCRSFLGFIFPASGNVQQLPGAHNTGLIPGKLSFNLPWRVGEGDVWWNKVLRVSAMRDGKQVPVIIEQSNMKAYYFRALMITEDGFRKRIARGKNLHAMLTFLKVDPQEGIHIGE